MRCIVRAHYAFIAAAAMTDRRQTCCGLRSAVMPKNHEKSNASIHVSRGFLKISRDERGIGHVWVTPFSYSFIHSFVTTPFLQLTMIFSINEYGSYESTTRCVAISWQIPALLNEMHFSVRQKKSLCRIFQVENDSIHTYDTC